MDDPRALISDYLDDELTAEQFAELEQWINASPENAAEFVRRSFADQDVRTHLIAEQSAQLIFGDDGAAGLDGDIMSEIIEQALKMRRRHEVEDEASRQLAGQLALEERHRRQRAVPAPTRRVVVIPKSLVWLGFAAALVLLAAVIQYFHTPTTPPGITERGPDAQSVPVLATVVRTLDARWDENAGGWDGGRRLRQGAHYLREGLVEIELAEGARVVLQGPVSFELTGANELNLIDGRLVAHVPQSAYGFTVDTPTARIIDYGTEFGVHADGQAQTRVQVYRGEVRAAPRHGGAAVGSVVPLVADEAAEIDAGGETVQRAVFDHTAFERRVVKRLDMVDIVAGGDGTGQRRDIGIDPTSGRLRRGLLDTASSYQFFGDGQFRPAVDSPLVAGVFVPGAESASISLPGGITLPALPPTTGRTYGLIWCGRIIPADRSLSPPRISSTIGGTDYATPGHQLISLHCNVGLVIDLDAIRAAYPGFEIVRVTAVVGNTYPSQLLAAGITSRSHFTAFLDAEQALSEPITVSDSHRTEPIQIDLDPGGARYLTLVSTDGGDGSAKDWNVMGDPVIELRPIR